MINYTIDMEHKPDNITVVGQITHDTMWHRTVMAALEEMAETIEPLEYDNI